MNTQSITALRTWLSRDKDGNEGIVAVTADGAIFPLIFGYNDANGMMEKTKEQALAACKKQGLELVLGVFKREL